MNETDGELKVGDAVSVKRAFTSEDIEEYLSLTRDPDAGLRINPPIVPTVLLASLFSRLLGMTLPGPGTNYLKQWLRFPGTARAGEEVEARVEVIRLRPEKSLVNLRTVCSVRGRTVCEGEALVLVEDVGRRP